MGSHPLKKVESIIRRGEGIKDPDAPDDPESVGFWVTRKAKFNDKVRVKQSQHLHMSGRATEGFINDVSSGVTPSMSTPALGDTNPTDALLALQKQLAGQGGGTDTGPYLFNVHNCSTMRFAGLIYLYICI